MPIYERFIGKHRDDFKTLEELRSSFKISYNDDFNFAYDVIDVLAKESPDKTAMVWLGNDGTEKIFTFADVARESDRAAKYFTSLGIKKGDSVLLVLRRHYLFWFCILGLHKIGAITVQATDMLMAKDYIYRCNKAEIKAVVITNHGDCTKYYDEGADQCTTVQHKLVIGHKDAGEGWIDFEKEFEATDPNGWERPSGDDAIKATDLMLLSFSSGTTSYPKMVAHDFRYPLGHIMTGVFWHRVVDGGLHFTVSDTGWLKSLWGKMYGQWFGESAIMVYDFDKFNGADILSVIEKYKVTTFCVPPTMYRFILQNDVKKYDLSSLVHCCTAGEALNPEIYNTWKEETGLDIYEGFGQTETTVAIGTFYPYMKPVLGAIGKSAPHIDVHIIDADGEDCPVGQVGEICVKTEYETRQVGLCHSYNKKVEDTKTIYYGGFFHTGDTAYTDELGYIHYVGRNDDIIKSSGYRIGPFEIESVLIEHPSVLEVAVTGVPDPVRGFNVKATIVLQKGYEGSPELVRELQNYVKKNTAPYKYPRVIEFVEALPKTTSGKVRRAEIRQRDMEKYLKSQQNRKETPDMEYSIQMYSLRDITKDNMDEALAKVSELGYSGVEFAGFFGHSADEINAMLKKHRLKISGTHSSWTALRDDFEKTLAYHKAIGNTRYIFPAADLSTEEKLNEFIDFINRVQPIIEKEGISIGYHNHSDEFLVNDYGKRTFYELAERTDIPFEIDIYWAYNAGEDPVGLMEKYKDRLTCIHIKDGFMGGEGVPLGKGTAPVKAVFEKAKELGILMVVESETLTPSGVAEAEICMNYLRSLEK